MWNLETEWYELVLRSAVVFAFLFIVTRIWGKKHLGQLAPFDFIILLIMSEGVQNAIIGDDKSIPGGMITVVTMVLLNSAINKMAFASPRAEKILEGKPRVLIKNGVVDQQVKEKEKVSDDELREALREQGVYKIEDVGLGVIETNGKFSVVRKEDTGFIQGDIQ